MNNDFPSTGLVAYRKKQYPAGTRVELVCMDDPQAPPIGTKGTVTMVDDIGTVHVNWDNGSSPWTCFRTGPLLKMRSVHKPKNIEIIWDFRKIKLAIIVV